MNIITILCVFGLFEICYARKKCVPKYHYWQPFYGTIPPKSYNAGVDKNGEVKYIARIFSIDGRTWSAPTTFSASKMSTFFGWEGETNDMITKYIELLMVEQPSPSFGWLRVRSKMGLHNLEENCCFVEGGYGHKDGKKYVAYVARVFDSGVYYIGGLYMPDWNNRDVMHYMEGSESKYMERNYEILAYDCCSSSYCIHHYFVPCCTRFRKKRKRVL